jgi:hypothetical protein
MEDGRKPNLNDMALQTHGVVSMDGQGVEQGLQSNTASSIPSKFYLRLIKMLPG